MDIKVNNIAQVTQVPDTVTTETGDGTFKFTLPSPMQIFRQKSIF